MPKVFNALKTGDACFLLSIHFPVFFISFFYYFILNTKVWELQISILIRRVRLRMFTFYLAGKASWELPYQLSVLNA